MYLIKIVSHFTFIRFVSNFSFLYKQKISFVIITNHYLGVCTGVCRCACRCDCVAVYVRVCGQQVLTESAPGYPHVVGKIILVSLSVTEASLLQAPVVLLESL